MVITAISLAGSTYTVAVAVARDVDVAVTLLVTVGVVVVVSVTWVSRQEQTCPTIEVTSETRLLHLEAFASVALLVDVLD